MTTERTRVRFSAFLALAFFAASPMLHAQQAPPAPAGEAPPVALGALIRPIKVDDPTFRQQAQAIPQEKRDHVHFFLINGLDPLYAGNLNGLAAHFRSIGFTNTSCHQFPSTPKVRKQIENIHRTDPEARFVVLGFSLGANYAHSLANSLQKDGIQVDCLIYLGGDTVFNTANSKPANVKQIVNITGHGLIFLGRDIYFKGEDIEGAANKRLDARHITLPAQVDTIQMVGKELIAVANQSNRATANPVQPTVSLSSPRP